MRDRRSDSWRAFVVRLAVMLAVLSWGASVAHAQAPATQAPTPQVSPTLSPEEARRALSVLNDEARRAEIVRVLQAIARATPTDAVAIPATPPAEATAPAAEAESPATIQRDGLLSQMLSSIADGADVVIDRVVLMVRPLAGLPAAWNWLGSTVVDPDTRALLLDAVWKVAVCLGLALLAEWAIHRALARPRRALVAAAAPVPPLTAGSPDARTTLGHRCLLAAGGFALDMLPILAFAIVGVAIAAIGTLVVAIAFEQRPAARLIIMILINAHVVWGVLTALAYRLTSPDIHRLRPLPFDDGDAAYAYRATRRLLTFVVYAIAAMEVARVLGMTYFAYAALLKLVILVAHAMLIVIVLRCRRPVAERIRGRAPHDGAFDVLRGWIAAVWHLAAIFFLLALWLVWAADVRDGYLLMLRYFFSTAVVLVAAQLLSIAVRKGLDRLLSLKARDDGRFSIVQERAARYYPLARRLVSVLVVVLTILALLQVWGVAVGSWFGEDGIGNRLLSATIIVAIAGILALAVWEAVNTAVERHLETLGHRGDRAGAARMRTLLPLLRSSLLVFIVGIVGLTALSEIGVNIAPLLAGAGIVGVAIGFGSQKLVQDVITGVFLLLENVVHVGDNVTVAGLAGTVENLSIRTIRLRAGDGSVHVIPFSSVGTVTNANRGIGNAAVSVTVDYAEDTDHVGEVLKDIAAEMRKDPAYSAMILDDLALWGVDSVNGGAVAIVGQIRCLDSGRWGVQREFNRRMKKRFQELGIRLADPSRTTLVEASHDDRQPVLPLPAEPGPTSATETRSPPPSALGHGA